jgi:hypothetical protein
VSRSYQGTEQMPENPSRSTSLNHILTRLDLAVLKRVRGAKVSHTAACFSAAAACIIGMASAGLTGHPGLAVAFLFGVSLAGLLCFLVDIRA